MRKSFYYPFLVFFALALAGIFLGGFGGGMLFGLALTGTIAYSIGRWQSGRYQKLMDKILMDKKLYNL